MESINSLSGGMNSDISKQLHSKDSYLQALNFRPLTEMGGSNGSLVNIKGNECKLTFPDLKPIFKLIVTEGTNTLPDNDVTFTINGVVASTSLTINNTTTGFDIYTFIINEFSECYQYTGSTLSTKTFAIAYEDNYVVIYQQPEYQDCTTVASIPTTILTSYSQVTTGAFTTLYFVNSNGVANSLIQELSDAYVPGCPGSLIIPIGSTFILNDNYILTATDNPTYGPAGAINEIPANDEFQFGGAIWKLNIDDITKQHTLTLIYSSNLDFTKYHPIPPSAISGRYESGEIQRIYWSDNYNKIRTLNVSIPQLMALSPTILSVMPKVEMTQGILQSINGPAAGSLSSGCWQMAYRLSKVLGSTTNFSELSNPVYLVPNPESSSFIDYEGATGATDKSITWHLTNLDTNYDQIEFVAIFRGNMYAVPEIKSVGLRTLTSTMDFTYANPGTSTYTDITLEEFLLFSGTFTHAKTCDTKDNRLFWGNVRAPKKELSIFDARAFRANDAGEIKLTNSGVSTVHTLSQAEARPQTDDCINEYFDTSGNYSSNACYLKPELIGLPTKLGGRGVNISYEFGTEIFDMDDRAAMEVPTEGWDLYTEWTGSPYRENVGNVPYAPSNMEYIYPQNCTYDSMKQPARTSLLTGFQHEEVYRFAFQAFDLEQNPYFTQWIGDIKMPSYGDVNSNPADAAYPDFRLSIYGPGNIIRAQILYIKFDIDVTRIKDIISGYQIVRVKRDGTDKTIWGVGMVNPLMSENMSDIGSTITLPANTNMTGGIFGAPLIPSTHPYYVPIPSQESIETLNMQYDTNSNPNFARFKTFDCFDMDIGLRPSFSVGDKLLIRSKLESINYRNSAGGYRQWFQDGDINYDSSGSRTPGLTQSMYNSGALPPPFNFYSTNDNIQQPFFIMKMYNVVSYCTYSDFTGSNINDYNYTFGTAPLYVNGNEEIANIFGTSHTFINAGTEISSSGVIRTCGGKRTLVLDINGNESSSFTKLYTSSAPYNCLPGDDNVQFGKLLALYYKPNNLLYGGNTYIARTDNEYIPCGEYISLHKNGVLTNINTSYKTFGGDVFTTCYDMMKTFKPELAGPTYGVFEYDSSGISSGNVTIANAEFSTSFFIPSTNYYNSELRLGNHPNRYIVSTAGYAEDDYAYNNYCNSPNDVKKYYPKPLNFQTADEWINRIYWSEIKFNNEIQDSWSVYLTDNFYDVEGNYGPINALVSLKENMYYIQERGIGVLMINPVSLINDQMGQPIKLGGGNATSQVIQKHYYKAIDTGTSHQWSVYRSQSAISFVDARHKKIYMFNGESVLPISDVKGQRNFVIKRLHNSILNTDNPVIDKGILTTYDYYHNEFLYTFNNVNSDTSQDENLTLAFSEVSNEFTGMYLFAPNLYINNNKYLISTKNTSGSTSHNKLWFHNYGQYGSFYGTTYPSNLKVILNDNPLYTKIFDNITWNSESVNDNLEWNDDFNLYPGSSTNPLYVDDVNNQSDTFTKIRCYNDWQNSDWINLSTIRPNNNLTRKERNFNIQVPRNKFNYDVAMPSVNSLFDPTYLTKVTFGERLRDKYLIVDLEYPNTSGNRFVIHNLKTQYRISDR